MKISIITPSYNHARFITDTIQSVANQDYPDYEHIIMDGGSTDGTIDILKRYPHLKWVSEEDTGQSNAINKGFAMASGDILAWINSDDYYEKNIFSKVAAFFQTNKDCHFLYGDMSVVDKDKNLLAKGVGDIKNLQSLTKNPGILRQPSCFWKKEVLNEIGYLDENLHLVMDYDFFMRIAKRHKLFYLPGNLSYFRVYQECKSKKHNKIQHRELRQVMSRHSRFGGYLYYRWILLSHIDNLKMGFKAFIKRIISYRNPS